MIFRRCLFFLEYFWNPRSQIFSRVFSLTQRYEFVLVVFLLWIINLFQGKADFERTHEQNILHVLLWSCFRSWLQLAIRRQRAISRSCSHVYLTLHPIRVSGPAPIWLHWRRSDSSWQKSWQRSGFKIDFPHWWSVMYKSAKEMMMTMLSKQQMYNSSAEETSMQILTHPQIPDVLLLPVDGPRYKRDAGPECVWKFFKWSIVMPDAIFLSSDTWSRSALRWWSVLSVAALCWEALTSLLQGSLPAPNVRIKQYVVCFGISNVMCEEWKAWNLPADMKAGDVVSVFSDLEGRCTRGATSFQGKRAFVGNGVAQMDRSRIFCSDQPVKYGNNLYML